jgi:tetratricopeptide (TPR) repeat protein
LIAATRAANVASVNQAQEDLRQLAAHTVKERLAMIYRASVCLTPALAWAMMDEANRLRLRAPSDALVWLEHACLVADGAARWGTVLAHELRVEAWKNYAWLLAYLGEYARAEDALDWADDAANQCADRRHMEAIVQLMRSILLSQMERWSEALPIAVVARQTFATLGDEDRRVKSVEQEALIRMKSGDAPGAVALLSGIVDLSADDMTRARWYSNIADALQMVGAIWVASDYLYKARQIHSRLNATTNLHHNTWVLARIMASASRLDESFRHFGDASGGFRALGAIDHAIRVDLDWSEAEIDHGAATSATYDRLRLAATYAIEKQLPVAKCRALEFLQMLGRDATVQHVRYVREFLERFASNPHTQFSPPEMFS